MIALTLPSPEAVATFNRTQSTLPYTYTPQNGTQEARIEGYDNDYAKVHIGQGDQVFERAKTAIRQWQMFPPGWTIILPQNAPIQEGTTVAMYARAFGLWWRNACRIVYVIDEPNRFGFAYGTLPGHIEKGEELFLVEKDAEGNVWYSIKAFSLPYRWMAKIGYPLIRQLQAKFRRDSGASIQKISTNNQQ